MCAVYNSHPILATFSLLGQQIIKFIAMTCDRQRCPCASWPVITRLSVMWSSWIQSHLCQPQQTTHWSCGTWLGQTQLPARSLAVHSLTVDIPMKRFIYYDHLQSCLDLQMELLDFTFPMLCKKHMFMLKRRIAEIIDMSSYLRN